MMLMPCQSNVKLMCTIEFVPVSGAEVQVIRIELSLLAYYKFMKEFLEESHSKVKSVQFLKKLVSKMIENDEKVQKLSNMESIFPPSKNLPSPKKENIKLEKVKAFWSFLSLLGKTPWNRWFHTLHFDLILSSDFTNNFHPRKLLFSHFSLPFLFNLFSFPIFILFCFFLEKK